MRAARLGRKLRAFPAAWAEQWPEALVITDRRGVIEYVNAAFEALTGYARREVLGRTPAVLHSGRQDAGFYRRLWRTLAAGRTFRGVFLNRRKSGALFYEEQVIRPVRGPDGRVAFVSSGRDVSAQVRERDRLRHIATHDVLTGLPNRALFLDRLDQAAREAKRRGEAFAVAIADLDGFRAANNRFGHLAGDAVLRTVARRTRRCLRAADTVARIGGDEFGVILAAPIARAATARVLEKVRAANALPIRYEGHKIRVTLSIGASLYPKDARTGRQLQKRADAAMYRAKRAGGDGCRFST